MSNPIQIFEDIASLRPESAPGAGPAPTVERALREVLGRAASPSDPAAFMSALERSFTPIVGPAPGVPPDTRAWSWTPRGSALQADLGALTGGQASLYRRAQRALEYALPLIDGLEPLISYDDEQAVAAAREVVRSELQRIVEEIGSEGGPSVGLVDQLFKSLVGQAPGPNLPRIPADAVTGHLGRLRDVFGLTRQLVNTVEEEQNYTNFLVLSDSITELWSEWGDFAASGQVFFGTQLVQISRMLEVAAESIHEVDAALDAVLIGPAERETMVIHGPPDVYLGALLEWADHFVAIDARELIQTAGKDGALSLVPTLQTLADQVHEFAAGAATPAPGAPSPLPSGFPTLYTNVVVESTLRALEGNLRELLDLIDQLEPPQPILGFPLRPPAIDPGIYLDRSSMRVAAGPAVQFQLAGSSLETAEIVATGPGPQVAVPLVPEPRPGTWSASIPVAGFARGMWTFELRRDGVVFQVGQKRIV